MRDFLLGVVTVVAAALLAVGVAAVIRLVDQSYAPVDASPISRVVSVPTAASSTSTAAAPSSPSLTSPTRKTIMTTVFWAGEGSTAENGYISNTQSYWDEQWGKNFGGIDDPENRCGYNPCGFTPKENPFYIALPYAEFNESGTALKASAKQIPWYGKSSLPLLKNRWVEVAYQGKTCYGQWEDVGPFLEDDFSYVFGTEKPHNTFGEKAGLDISPALWDCLGMQDNALTSWRFVDAKDVPEGPWLETITTSGISWQAYGE